MGARRQEVVEDIVDFEVELDLPPPKTIASSQYTGFDISEVESLELFGGLNTDELGPMLQKTSVLTIEKGQTLLRTGQLNSRVFIVLDGSLNVFPDTEAKKKIGVVEQGQATGLLAALSGAFQAETLVADERSRLFVLDSDLVVKLAERYHPIALRLIAMMRQAISGSAFTRIGAGAAFSRNDTGRESQVDELTGLHNRAWLEKMLPRHMQRHAEDRAAMTLVALEVEDIDSFGAEFGEEIAQHGVRGIADVITANARPTDVFVRYGKGSFIGILPKTGLDGAHALSKRLMAAIAESSVEVPGECILPPLPVVVGVVQIRRIVDVAHALQQVDAILQDARSRGGSGWISEASI